jgi:plasmid stability protein
MTDLVLKDLDPGVLARLKARADAHGVPVEHEAESVLREAMRPAREDPNREAARIRGQIPWTDIDVDALIGAGRDE